MSELLPAMIVLAQGADKLTERQMGEASRWMMSLLGIVLFAFVAAGIVIYIVRSRALKEDAVRTDVPLTLAELKRMRARGQIDDDEMAKLKEIVMAQAKKPRVEPPKPPPSEEGL
jgi:uncharacterized membrane protein